MLKNKLYPILFGLIIGGLTLFGCSSDEKERRICFNYESVHIRTYKSDSFNNGNELNNLRSVEKRVLNFTGQPIEFRAIETDNCKNPCSTNDLVEGCYQSYTGEVVIRPSLFYQCEMDTNATYDKCFQAILLHEMLHSFGLEHITEPGLMNDKNGLMDITEADRIECKRADAIYSRQADLGQHICQN